MRKLALLIACLTLSAPFAVSIDGAYKYRQTVEIVETAGIPRFSYPIHLNLAGKDISESLNDIRITDVEGNFLDFSIVGKVGANVRTLIPVTLKPNEKKTLYAFYGNRDADRPATSFGGIQQYIGVNFVTFAWGTVRISSYTKNNKITITDNSNKTLKDANGQNIASETYQAGTQRTFTLANPSMIKISCTGLASVAIGNFATEETDSEAVIAGNILLYVPKFLAITSFHVGNKVQVWNGAELAQEKILGIGESLVFDGIPSGFRRIIADNECLIQYGTASAFSLFSVPGRGNVYRFLPLGPIAITGEEGINVDISYPDGRMPDKYTIGKSQTINIDTQSYLKNIGTDKTVKAIEIRSSKPVTILGTGGAGGHGATFLPGNDGFYVSKSWTTMTGNVDKVNPTNRNARLIAPYSNTRIDGGGSQDLFKNLAPGGLALSDKEFSVEFSGIDLKTTENCLLLDGNPEDTATFFQVPALSDNTVKVTVPKTETVEGGWVPGKIETAQPEKEKPAEDSGFVTFLKGVWSRINPKENPLAFALTLIGLAVLFILLASIFVRKRKSREAPESRETPEPEPKKIELEDEFVPPPPEKPRQEQSKKADWFERILEDKEQPSQESGFRAPKLRAPKISQFIDRDTNQVKEFEKTEDEPDLFSAPDEPPASDQQPKPEAAIVEPQNEPEQAIEPEPQPQKEPVSEIDRFEIPVSKITPMIRNLAHQLSGEGVVADPGSLVRLYKEGMIDLFSRIYIAAQSATILPSHIASMPILEKVTLTPKDLEKVSKAIREYGVFEEVARALVLAEKNGLPHMITTARLPEKLGKIKITSINSFC